MCRNVSTHLVLLYEYVSSYLPIYLLNVDSILLLCHRYSAAILSCRAVSREIVFRSREEMSNFHLKQHVYFHGQRLMDRCMDGLDRGMDR